jgi:protein SCO1/2
MTARRPFLPAARAAALAAALSALSLALAGCDGAAPGAAAGATSTALDLRGATYAQDFALPDTEGRVRTLADFRGKVVLVFFGYTQCPDVCPTTMAELVEARRALGAEGARVQGIFVTVDPERDTAELLRAYTENFQAGIVGLRGTPEQVRETARAFKVYYNKVPGRTETSYTIDHTAGSYVYDTQGRLRLFTRYGSGARALADDLKRLLAEAPA